MKYHKPGLHRAVDTSSDLPAILHAVRVNFPNIPIESLDATVNLVKTMQ